VDDVVEVVVVGVEVVVVEVVVETDFQIVFIGLADAALAR
jgi:hypothetical protein